MEREMKREAARQCIEEEMEYREWRESPLWYCLKTTMNNATCEVKSEIVKDSKTGVCMVIQGFDKPLDGTFETVKETVYYTYHQGYRDAAWQLAATAV